MQIVGSVINAEQKLLLSDMLAFGCELILIDGAIDRKNHRVNGYVRRDHPIYRSRKLFSQK